MTDSPSSTPAPDLLETRDWSLAAVTAYLHDDPDAQALVLSEIPPFGTEALAMMCASQIQVIAAMEGKSAEEAMQDFALRLVRISG